jgi:TonB family protein
MKLPAVALLALALIAPTAAPAADIFIGTITAEGADLILTRCDIGDNRYLLRDEDKDGPVSALRKRLPSITPPVYAEVIGEYGQEGEANLLTVTAIDAVTPNRNCHLSSLGDSLPEQPISPRADNRPDPPMPHLMGTPVEWQAQVATHLARFQRYPPAAAEQEISGIAYVLIHTKRNGQIVSANLHRSSGQPLLDAEAVRAVRAANPLPAMPGDPAASINFILPVRFVLMQ